MVILIDNYDSFSYNLYQMIGSIESNIMVIRNDQMSVNEIMNLKPSEIIISPGPGRPENAGICIDLIKEAKGKIKVLGVCLGHQAICQVYGGNITYAKQLCHGKSSEIIIKDNSILFSGLEKKQKVARYHSLAVEYETIEGKLDITAVTFDKEVMAVEKKEDLVFGVQFHPESIMTKNGLDMIKNFMTYK